MYDFKHYIITLFNLRNFLDGTNNYEKWVDWTTDRIELFKKICLPSVVNQINQNFEWWLFMDSDSPTELINDLSAAIKPYPNIILKYKKGYDDFYKTYVEDLKAESEGFEFIIQTRFDNDDILHPIALSEIQAKFKPIDKLMIELGSGYTLESHTGYLSHYYYSMGPFLTIIERRNQHILGIYKCNHWQWPGLKMQITKEILKKINVLVEPVIFINHKPLWIQYIHGKNMHNSSNRGLPILKETSLSEFSTSLKMNPSPFSRILKHLNYVWLKRYYRGWFCKTFQITN